MADKVLSYMNYTGTIDVSVEDGCLHGRLMFINDIVTYEGNTVPELEASFRDAVDRYLAYCASTGREADKPFSGTFNVRIGEDRHRKLAQKGAAKGLGINEAICAAIDQWVAPVATHEMHNHWHIHMDPASSMTSILSTSRNFTRMGTAENVVH